MLRPWIAALLAFAAFALTANAQDASPLTDEDRADLVWFDGLGYPAADAKQFVRVFPGWNDDTRGFLLEEDDAKFRVLTTGLDEWTMVRSPPGVSGERRVGFERLRLDDVCEDWLYGGPSPAGERDQFPLGAEPSVQVQVLVLASALHRVPKARHAYLVHGLLEHARSLRHEHWRHYPTPDDPSRPLRERAALDLAAVDLHRAKTAIIGVWYGGDGPPQGWAADLARFEAIVRRFPGTPTVEEADRFVTVLQRMVREEEERAQHAGGAAAAPNPDEHVTELIYRLRDQRSDGRWVNGGAGNLASGPFTELVALGHSAVPALIKALHDDSLTRYGGEGRSGMHPYVYHVGALAKMALEQIAGRGFQPPDVEEVQWGDRVRWVAACRPTIEAWWAEVQAGGEIDALVGMLERGNHTVAKTVLARAPDRLPGALVRGFANAVDTYDKDEFLALLHAHGGDAGRALIRNEAQGGNHWTRFEAALLLASADDPEAVDRLLELWDERRDGKGPSLRAPDVSMQRDRTTELKMIVDALLKHQRVDVVEHLADGLPGRSPRVRRVLVRALAAARPNARGNVGPAIDRALAAVLDDRTEYADEFGEQVRAVGLALRVRDVAAAALAAPRGLAAPQHADPLWARDAAVGAVADAWAREHMTDVPLRPPVPAPPAVDEAWVASVVEAFAASTYGTDDRKQRLTEIRALGLSALPAIRRRLATGDLGYVLDLQRAVAEMAFGVRAVHIEPTDAQLPEALRAKLAALSGRIVTAALIEDAAWAMIDCAGKTYQGASLDVHRAPDDRGVVVTLTVLDGLGGGWDVSGLAAIDEKFVVGCFGGGWSRRGARRDASLREVAERALAAGPDSRVWLHVRVQRRPHDQ